MSSTATTLQLCSKSDVDEGQAIKIARDDLELAVYKVDGQFYVTNDTCTHGPGSLSEGFLEGHIIECDFHGGCFDIRNGDVVAAPCLIPLKTYRVIENESHVVIEVEV